MLERGDGRSDLLDSATISAAIGRWTPLDFLRRPRIEIAGDCSAGTCTTLTAFLILCAALWINGEPWHRVASAALG